MIAGLGSIQYKYSVGDLLTRLSPHMSLQAVSPDTLKPAFSDQTPELGARSVYMSMSIAVLS